MVRFSNFQVVTGLEWMNNPLIIVLYEYSFLAALKQGKNANAIFAKDDEFICLQKETSYMWFPDAEHFISENETLGNDVNNKHVVCVVLSLFLAAYQVLLVAIVGVNTDGKVRIITFGLTRLIYNISGRHFQRVLFIKFNEIETDFLLAFVGENVELMVMVVYLLYFADIEFIVDINLFTVV